MKRQVILGGIAIALASTVALAQETPPATSGDTPAVATPAEQNPAAPVAGENSFTEEQARERIAEAGYREVSALKLDESGVWRGTAMKEGKSVAVALDFQGNVVAN
ncbi:PepSY domain-containing protein [Mycoplana sp. MJR14]|uniref:PepSY domain-containing protein n=1 Tax=Mycoplana sp. MJR14 TaxID=3032583 RepID=UPI000DD79AA4|nr:PepSY domain-containing protein [Mycoplana sp. MJR14]MDF1631228.1 PepSY domain-containing protein [Mycoplana sp. MJR14]